MDREGFQQLVTEVGLGHAGIVMGLEVSRLARNSSDWHRLLEICALTDTLILEEIRQMIVGRYRGNVSGSEGHLGGPRLLWNTTSRFSVRRV